MKITGGCFCGEITYAGEIDEGRVGVCHCRDCQIFSGSAYRLATPMAPDALEFLTGTPSYFEKMADSGKVRKMAFCGTCGTHLCSMPADPKEEGAFISMRIASADQFSQLTPSFELFCSSQVEWQSALEGTHRFEKMPVGT
jgi:hypothetical protein